MPRVIRRGTAFAVVVALLLAATSSAAAVVVPEGPRLSFIQWIETSGQLVLATGDAAGGSQQVLAGGSKADRPLPYPAMKISWSPDGQQLAFSGVTGRGEEGQRPDSAIFLAAADGSGLRRVPGTSGGLAPVFAPNGGEIAFAREARHPREHRRRGESAYYRSVSSWLVDLATGTASQLTPWRDQLIIAPSSFSSDGSTLLLSRENHKGLAIVAMPLDGGPSKVLAGNASGAVYSPDGTRIAFLRLQEHTFRRHPKHGPAVVGVSTTTDLFVVKADGTGVHRLTRTPSAAEYWPSWDPSGQRLAYTRFETGTEDAAYFGFGDAIMEINSDGSCPTRILSAAPKSAYYAASWQPGPGREAGPIAC